MRLWRLSGRAFARALDGGYGLHFDGRWNAAGHAVTYCATSPALCVLEKLVHVEDPTLLPEMVMVSYDIPDTVAVEDVPLSALPVDWRRQEALTQNLGDTWHGEKRSLLLRVPSAIVPVAGSPDLNIVVNHNHPDAPKLRIVGEEPFVLDPRLF